MISVRFRLWPCSQLLEFGTGCTFLSAVIIVEECRIHIFSFLPGREDQTTSAKRNDHYATTDTPDTLSIPRTFFWPPPLKVSRCIRRPSLTLSAVRSKGYAC